MRSFTEYSNYWEPKFLSVTTCKERERENTIIRLLQQTASFAHFKLQFAVLLVHTWRQDTFSFSRKSPYLVAENHWQCLELEKRLVDVHIMNYVLTLCTAILQRPADESTPNGETASKSSPLVFGGGLKFSFRPSSLGEAASTLRMCATLVHQHFHFPLTLSLFLSHLQLPTLL